jgi:hypothetical protein
MLAHFQHNIKCFLILEKAEKTKKEKGVVAI